MNKTFAAMALAIGTLLASPSFAQDAGPTCVTVGAFSAEAAKVGVVLNVVSGEALKTFDRVAQQNGMEPMPDVISTIAFPTPDVHADPNAIAEFMAFNKEGCALGAGRFRAHVIRDIQTEIERGNS